MWEASGLWQDLTAMMYSGRTGLPETTVIITAREAMQVSMMRGGERRQRFSSIKAYILFIAICLFLIFITSCVLAGDIKLRMGNSVEVPYDRVNGVAYVYDSDNKIYAVGIDALSQLKGDNVVLYYTGDNIASAKPVTVVWFYVVMYMAWIAILIFLIFAAWKKFHGSHHAVEHTGKSRFDD